MQPCGIDSLPQWLLPCLSAMAVVSGIRLLRRPAVRQVLLISSPALGGDRPRRGLDPVQLFAAVLVRHGRSAHCGASSLPHSRLLGVGAAD
jgi:hypothetical protein